MDQRRQSFARWNYIPRLGMTAYTGIGMLFTVPSSVFGTAFWLAWCFHFVIWGHLAFILTRLASDAKRAEIRNMRAETIAFGVWIALAQYQLGPALALLGASLMTHTTVFGIKKGFGAVLLFVVGAAGGGLLTGFDVHLDSTLTVQLLAYGGIFVGILVVGVSAYSQHQLLRQAKRSVDHQKSLFEALLRASAAIHQSSDIEALLSGTIERFRELMPDLHFGIVLCETGRPGSVRHIQMPGIAPADGALALQRLHLNDQSAEPLPVTNEPGQRLLLMSMSAHLRQLDGTLLVQGPMQLGSERLTALQLFCDQVGSALESSLLTQKLERLAHTDGLTGCFNRTYFTQAFEQAAHAKRGPASVAFSIINIDINGLKRVNDTYGHNAGDAMIVCASKLLRGAIRDIDHLFRMGGDEFVILCVDCATQGAELVINRLRATELNTVVELLDVINQPISVPLSLSIGSACTDSVEIEDLIRVADERMYADKQTHYGRISPLHVAS